MRRIIFGFLLAITTLSAEAAGESLMIGSARLSLGMDRPSAWALLKNHDAKCVGEKTARPPDCDSWIVSSRRGSQYTALGNVYFKDGKLKKIYKYYDSEQWKSKPEIFASFLYEVLRQHSLNGESFVASTGEVREPGWNAKSIFFKAGRRTIVVGYHEGGTDPNGKPFRPDVALHVELE